MYFRPIHTLDATENTENKAFERELMIASFQIRHQDRVSADHRGTFLLLFPLSRFAVARFTSFKIFYFDWLVVGGGRECICDEDKQVRSTHSLFREIQGVSHASTESSACESSRPSPCYFL